MSRGKHVASRWPIFRDPGLTYVLVCGAAIVAWAYFTGQGISRTAVGTHTELSAWWNGVYIVAVIFTIARLFSGRPTLERAALVCLGGGMATNLAVSLTINGAGDARSYVFLPFLAAVAVRFAVLADEINAYRRAV